MQQMHGMIGLRSRVAELAKDPTTRAIAIGVTAVALTPVVLPLIKPALKSTIKTSVLLLERTKAALSETGEMLADIAAEARTEAMLETQRSLQLKSAKAAMPSASETRESSHA